MRSFRASVRNVPSFKLWFDYADNLNRLGLEMLQDYELPVHDNQRLAIASLFVRAHHSFQAAILLAERGMSGDARVVLRSAVEGAIALNALANDATFLDQLIAAHRYNQRKIARLTLNTPAYKSVYEPEQIVQMEKTVKEIDSMEAAAGKKLSDINFGDVALNHCKDLYDLLYRLLSGDGTHTNINAIHRYIEYDAAGQVTGLKAGPSITDMIEVLKAACLMFLWAADPFARAAGQDTIRTRIQDEVQRFSQLPMKEPAEVTVEANFG